MKVSSLILLAGLAVGGVLLYKHRAQLGALFNADPSVNGLARAQYGSSQEVPGTLSSATGIAPRTQGGSAVSAALAIVSDVLGNQGSSGSASPSVGLAANSAPQLVTGQADGSTYFGDAFGMDA